MKQYKWRKYTYRGKYLPYIERFIRLKGKECIASIRSFPALANVYNSFSLFIYIPVILKWRHLNYDYLDTVILLVAVYLPSLVVTVMVTLPAFLAVTTPVAETVAIDVLEDFQVTAGFVA